MARKAKVYWDKAKHEPILISLHAAGKSDKEIGAVTGHALETIRHYRRSLGLPSNVMKPLLKPKLSTLR